VHLDPALGELQRGSVAMRVIAQGAEEVDARAELGEHDGHHPTAPCGTRKSHAFGVEHLSRLRHPPDRNEVDPLHVANYGEAGHGDAA
jgi:hypothetical protein